MDGHLEGSANYNMAVDELVRCRLERKQLTKERDSANAIASDTKLQNERLVSELEYWKSSGMYEALVTAAPFVCEKLCKSMRDQWDAVKWWHSPICVQIHAVLNAVEEKREMESEPE